MALTPVQVVIVLIVVLAFATLVYLWARNRKSAELKSRFGAEYERTLQPLGDER